MSCYCDYEPAEMYVANLAKKAYKTHQCSECFRRINEGESYEKVVGKWDGNIGSFKTCVNCLAVRDFITAHIPCFCWSHAGVLEDAKEAINDIEEIIPGLLFGFGRLIVAVRKAGEIL